MATSMREVHASHDDLRWRPRPGMAVVLAWLALGIPVLAGLATAAVVAHLVPPPEYGVLVWLWRALVVAAATAVSFVAERRLRNVVRLSTLLKLSLVFPDEAPSRFSVALRTGTASQLRRRLAGAGPDQAPVPVPVPASAAELLRLVDALNAHDRLTRGHSERVRAYARLIGEELRLDPEALDRLSWAALLHDVGKLDVPRETLTEPGKLNAEQWAQIKKHPEAGARLTEPLIAWLGPWGLAVRDHHERWDGGGYPRGIAGTDISLAGRIVAVADAFDVMTAARSYKPPRSAAAGREELLRCSGTQFDPAVVRAFLNLSVGRLHRVIGPLSWLAQLPLLGRIPLATAAGNAAMVAATPVLTVGSLLGVGPMVPAQGPTESKPAVTAAASPRGATVGQPADSGRAQGTGELPTIVASPGGAGTADSGGAPASPTAPSASSDRAAPPVSPTPTTAPKGAATTTTTAPTSNLTASPPAEPTTTTTGPHDLRAGDDTATIVLSRDDEIVIPIRANDKDSADHSFKTVAVSSPSYGEAEVLSNGSLRYVRTAPVGAGTDTFTYTVVCDDGQVVTATVTVTAVN